MGIWLRERITRKRTSTEESTVGIAVSEPNAKASHHQMIPMLRLFRHRQEPIKLTTLHGPSPMLDDSVSLASSSSDDEVSSFVDDSSKREHQHQVRFCSTLVYHNQDEAGEWYTNQELHDIQTSRWAEQQILSRGLDRRSDRSYGMVLFRMLMRFRHAPSDEESFHVDTTDFKLLE